MELINTPQYRLQQYPMQSTNEIMTTPEDTNTFQKFTEDYYSKPQMETHLNYLYVTPAVAELKENPFTEWTRDSILSNYSFHTMKKIMCCIEEIRILEMMRTDAEAKGDYELINQFINPMIRFNMGEKFGLENCHRNIGGYAGQLSRSSFTKIEEIRSGETVEQHHFINNNNSSPPLKLPSFKPVRWENDFRGFY